MHCVRRSVDLARWGVVAFLATLAVVGCSDARVTPHVRSSDQVIRAIARLGYHRTEPSPGVGTGLGFPFQREYGEPLGEYTRRGSSLRLLLVRASQNTRRPNDPAIYWFKSGRIILIGLAVPPTRKTATEFSAVLRSL